MYQCRTVKDLDAVKARIVGEGRGSRVKFATMIGISPKTLDKYSPDTPERPITGALRRSAELLMVLKPDQLSRLKKTLGVE